MHDAKTVLIVDDEPDVRFVLRVALEKGGFAVEEAQDGLEALSKLKSVSPAVILLDIMMPKMDGYAFHQKLKEDPQTADIPVVIITGKGQMKELWDLRQDLKIVAYLEKPFPVAMLIGKLKELFEPETAT